MNYIKINNLLIGENGSMTADYKGLDINKIVAGSQIYPKDNTAYFMYTGNVVHHEDIVVLTEEEYNLVKNREIPKSDVEILQEKVNNLTLAMASMLGM